MVYYWVAVSINSKPSEHIHKNLTACLKDNDEICEQYTNKSSKLSFLHGYIVAEMDDVQWSAK